MREILKEKKGNKKNNIIFCILLVLLILAIIITVYYFNNETKKLEDAFEANHIIDNTDTYNIRVSYPIFKNTQLNNEIKGMVDSEIEQFKDSVKDLKEVTDSEVIYEFNMDYNYKSYKNVYSFHMIIYEFSGGAHYIRLDKVVYYDAKTNKKLEQKELFKPGKNYLERLSKLAKERIEKVYETRGVKDLYADFIEMGTEPTEENFSYIDFSKTGLSITFPPYQVGPWSEGLIEIKINYDEIRDILNDKYINESLVDDEITNENNLDILYIPVPSKMIEQKPPVDNSDANQYKGKKVVALTFDDGPSPTTTPKLLDGLNQRGVKATFFVLGNRAENAQGLIKRMYNDGHSVGIHTYDHKNLNNLGKESALWEINHTNDIIQNITGKRPTLLRPPYGNITDEIKSSCNMPVILWSIDPLDWKDRDEDKAYNNIISTVKSGDIILMHDIYKTSVDAALRVIDKLKADGYEFVTVETLAKAKGINLNNGTKYYNFR